MEELYEKFRAVLRERYGYIIELGYSPDDKLYKMSVKYRSSHIRWFIQGATWSNAPSYGECFKTIKRWLISERKRLADAKNTLIEFMKRAKKEVSK